MKPQLIKVIFSIAFLFSAFISKSQSTSCETAQNVSYACSESNAPNIGITSDDLPNITLPLACPLVEFQASPTREYWISFTAYHINVNVKLDWSQGSSLGNFNPMMEVYSGNCSSLQYVSCQYNQQYDSDQDLYLSGLTVGQVYYIRVLDNNYVDPTGEFGWSTYYYIEVCADCGNVNGAAVSSTTPLSNCTGIPIPLSAPSINGVSYQWQYNGENIEAATSNQLMASQTGAYSLLVTPSSSVVCPAYSTAASIIHIGTPAQITFQGQPALCDGQTTTLQAPLAPGNSYQWGNAAGAILGALASSYDVSTPGTYSLTLSDGVCPSTTDNVTITTGIAPTAPLITPQGILELCNGSTVVLSAQATAGITYQWTMDGNIINNETTTNYTADATGIYCLVASNASGCKDTSNCLPVTNCVGFETVMESAVKLYPNPASELLNIELSLQHQVISIAVTDLQGRILQVKSTPSVNGTYSLAVAELTNGVYQIRILTNQGQVTKRFVKYQ
jgi:hypothetical protein